MLFRVAQPTVSMHVKLLRQSGLVRSERLGGRLRLSADPGPWRRCSRVTRGCAADRSGSAQAWARSTTGSDRMPATVVDSTRSAPPVTA